MFVLFLESPALKWTGAPPLAVIPRRNPCPASIPHLDFLAPTSGTPCHFLSLVCLQCCYISRWCFSCHANSSRFVLSWKNYGEKKKKSFGSKHFWAIFHVGSGSQHIHRAWQKTSHTLRGTFRDAELLFQPQFSSFDAIHSCLSFCEAEIGQWTVNLGKKKYFYASFFILLLSWLKSCVTTLTLRA